jgi:hypothetical protein
MAASYHGSYEAKRHNPSRAGTYQSPPASVEGKTPVRSRYRFFTSNVAAYDIIPKSICSPPLLAI